MNYKWLNDEQKYIIFNNGKVYSTLRNRFIIPTFMEKYNYYRISFVVNNKNKKYILHTLLYNLFIGEINKGHYVWFNDDNIHNIHTNNLIQKPRNENKYKIEFNKDEWTFIPNYEERYIINKKGEIKSLITNKILEDNYNEQFGQSYKSVKLIDKNGKRNSYLIHTLVYRSFIGEIDKDMVIDHIDQDKFNNKLKNLRLVSLSVNSLNCIKGKSQKNNDKIQNNNFINIGTKYKNIDLSNYEINEYGQIRNVNGHLLKSINYNLYKVINIADCINKKRKHLRVHQLVASVFLENPNNYTIVHHKDNNRDNNHISNLEWTTHIKNITYTQGKKLGQYTLKDEFIKEYESVNDAFRELNKQYGANIRWVCEGKRQTAFGYKWKWI